MQFGVFCFTSRGVVTGDPQSLPAPPAYHSPQVPVHPPPPYHPPAPVEDESSSDDEEIKYRDDDDETITSTWHYLLAL